jgi:hypothetical protein
VISPLLFLIFINDIDVDLDLETAASLFSDDTSSWRRDGKVRGSGRILMQEEINKILIYILNKTKSMVISSKEFLLRDGLPQGS